MQNNWEEEFDRRFRIVVDSGFDKINQLHYTTTTFGGSEEEIKQFIKDLLKKNE